MKVSYRIWKFLIVYESFSYMEVSGSFLLYMEVSYCIWKFLIVYGSFLSYMEDSYRI